MNRVEAAINEGRCVLAIGGRALQNSNILMELRRRRIPSVALGGDPVTPVLKLNDAALAPAVQNQGGIIVLVEPEGAMDGRALGELASLLKQGGHKPKLYVAAKAFNPFAMPMSMRLLKLEQIKSRALDFIVSLPLSAPPVAAAAPQPKAAKPKKEQLLAPRPALIGREEELEQLTSMLAEDGGPIVVHGPLGVGCRWLVESALAKSALTRIPDFTIGRGCGADTLLGRVALAAARSGHPELANKLRDLTRKPSETPSPQVLVEKFIETLSCEGLKGKVLVIHHLHRLLDRRDSSFYREGRLELLLRGILLSQPALRVVFISERAPTFYREGQATNIRRLEVGGVRGKELHELFACWHAPEFARSHFGPISERIHGHPMYARQLAIAVRAGGDIEDILERPKFLKAATLSDVEPLSKHIKKQLSKLDDSLMSKLCAVALFREPVSPVFLQSLGINRKIRLALITEGFLEQTPVSENRGYYVHPLIRDNLDNRKVNDFPTMEELGQFFLEQALVAHKQEQRQKALALQQEGNRLLVEARRARSRVSLPFPDSDPIVETIRALLRRKNPRYDIARMRVTEGLREAPGNPELLLCDAELKVAEKRKHDEIQAIYDRIAEHYPTPEAVHHECSYHLNRNARGKAIAALERGIALFEGNGRLRRRLAGLYLRQNRLELAGQVLRAAADLEPMMPDNYSMLGEVYVRMGAARWEEADQVITEARRIAPESPVHMLRAASLLRARALIDADQHDALLAEASALLGEVLKRDPGYNRAMVMQATTILDQGGDLEQAQWLLKRAMKRHETAEGLTQRARILLREGKLDEASRILDRANKKESAYHPAYGIRGELLQAQGDLFRALEAYKTARERSPRTAPERAVYEAAIANLGALFESGEAINVMKGLAEAEGDAGQAEQSTGPRRAPGQTTVRRTRDGKIVDVIPAEKPAAEEAPATEAAAEEAPATEAAAEEAPATEAAAEEEAAAPLEPEEVPQATASEAAAGEE